jgi:Tau95 Triple barrel domain
MELWFRARNIDCKPAYGDRKSCNSLLLKVRRRRKSGLADAETSPESSQHEFEYDVKILGVVDVMYKFQSKHVDLFAHRKTTKSYRLHALIEMKRSFVFSLCIG